MVIRAVEEHMGMVVRNPALPWRAQRPTAGWRSVLGAVALALVVRGAALAVEADTPAQLERVVVTGTIGRVRAEIVPSIGATTYTIAGGQIDAIAQGENAPFSQVLLRAPGVVQDSFGEDHV